MIPNPVYVNDEKFGVFEEIAYVGIEVFQAKPGSIYDNILLTDDLAYAEQKLRENFLQYRDEEFSMYRRVQQDKAAEEELRKLREKENQQVTDEELYTGKGESGSEISSSTTIDEDTKDFVFPTDDVTDPPTAADFEFPFDVEHNKYFLEKQKMNARKSSAGGRRNWREHRLEKQHGQELPEDREFSE
jgi:calreticulin